MVTREDLSPGQQAIQAAHALRQFTAEHPEIDKAWFEKSNTLALLGVKNEAALGVIHKKALCRDIPVAAFREPDRDNELTAIAIGPTGKQLTKNLPLALRDPTPQRQPDD